MPDFDWLKTAMPFSDDSDWLTYFSRDFLKPVTKLVSLNGLGMWTLLRRHKVSLHYMKNEKAHNIAKASL